MLTLDEKKLVTLGENVIDGLVYFSTDNSYQVYFLLDTEGHPEYEDIGFDTEKTMNMFPEGSDPSGQFENMYINYLAHFGINEFTVTCSLDQMGRMTTKIEPMRRL